MSTSLQRAAREKFMNSRVDSVIGAKLYPPYISSPGPAIYVDDSVPCLHTRHTLELLSYKKKVKSLLHELQQKGNKTTRHKKSKADTPIESLQIPAVPKPLLNKLALRENSYSFSQGIAEAPVPISPAISQKILQKAIICICAHAGYDVTTDSALKLLTNVTQKYMENICKVLHFHAYGKAYPEDTVFPDSLEQTCFDIGIGSMTSLLDFYQQKVIQYHDRLTQECVHVTKNYEMLKLEKTKLNETENQKSKKRKK